MSAASDFSDRGPASEESERAAWRHHHGRHCGRSGPPLPIKLLAVAGAFWIAPPLGVAALGYWAWRAWRRNGGGDPTAHAEKWRAFAECRPWRRHGAYRSSGNAAFDERRRETLRAIEEEAEAFAEFERRQREARDREDFERFMAERKAAEAGKREEPKAPEAK
jgi:hypothetical protein